MTRRDEPHLVAVPFAISGKEYLECKAIQANIEAKETHSVNCNEGQQALHDTATLGAVTLPRTPHLSSVLPPAVLFLSPQSNGVQDTRSLWIFYH